MKKLNRDNKGMYFLLGIVAIILVLAFLGDNIVPHDPTHVDMSVVLEKPSSIYWFGTDNLGRCVFSRVICGIKTSLFSTLIIVLAIFIIGTLVGVFAGYFGGIVDDILMKITIIVQSFPAIVLAIAVAGMLGPGITNAIIALSIVHWTRYARISRSLVIGMKEHNYIKASILSGASDFYVIFKHIIPNIISTVIVTATLDIGTMMLEMASLSFLGLGAQSPTPEWGIMMSEGRKYLENAPWMIIYPGVAILIVVVIFNLLGDNLREKFAVK